MAMSALAGLTPAAMISFSILRTASRDPRPVGSTLSLPIGLAGKFSMIDFRDRAGISDGHPRHLPPPRQAQM